MSAVTFAKKNSGAPSHARTAAPSAVPSGLRIGEPDDQYEQEADRIADEVMHGGSTTRHWSLPRTTPEGSALRRCSCGASATTGGECAACREKREADSQTLRRKPAGRAESSIAPPIVHDVLNSPGQPLDETTRDYFEPRFGHDLSMVRVHSDSMAARSAGSVHAKAYTVGNHIAFAEGEFAPSTFAGRTLLGHELVHVAQQANGVPSGSAHRMAFTGAPIHLARSDAPYVSPYNEALARELFERLRQLRIVEGGTIRQQANRVAAVAAVFDGEGNRIGTIARLNALGGAHAEELVVQEIQNKIAAGEKIAYTVLMVDQDPCPGRCTPLLKEWRADPRSGTLRTVTPMAANKNDPSQFVKGKTAYKRALTQDVVPFEPKAPPPDSAAALVTRGEHSQFRLPIYKEPTPKPGTGNINTPPPTAAAGDVAGDLGGDVVAGAGAKALKKAEEQAAEHALEDAAAGRLTKQLAKSGEKDLAEVTTEAFAKGATSVAERRLAQATAPLIGAAFAFPDAWKGVKDLAHGNVVLGLGTIGVAIVDVASQGLHLTDEITAGGGTILAITIQTWAAGMQFAFEAARISTRAAELKAYMKAHGGGLPPRDELMSYYGLNDEDILLLENDIRQAQINTVTTEDLAKHVRSLLAQIDANADQPLPQGVTPESIQKERATLGKLLVALEVVIERKRAESAKERAAAEEKRRQANFDRAQQQQKQAARAKPTQQFLPTPGAPQQQPAAATDPFGSPQRSAAERDPFNILSGPTAQPLSGISMENAELAATGFGRRRSGLLSHYQKLESEHVPSGSDKVTAYKNAVSAYVRDLDRMIAMFRAKGSAEWPGVKEMLRLRDAADNEDKAKLMR